MAGITTDKVAVTGYGLIVRNHDCPSDLFNSLMEKKSLICEDRLLKKHGINNIPSAKLTSTDIDRLRNQFSSTGQSSNNRVLLMAYCAGENSLQMAGLTHKKLKQYKCELFFANNKMFTDDDILNRYFNENISPSEYIDIEHFGALMRPYEIAEKLIEHFHTPGQPRVYSDACTAGMVALYSAYLTIKSGRKDIALVGASEEATHPITQTLFKNVRALYDGKFTELNQSSRAFDKDRAGCVLADASAFLVVENYSHAIARKAKILAEIAGMSRQSEGYKMTSTDLSGQYYLACMSSALKNAELLPEDIDHINSHGTSTVNNDLAESKAINALFPHNPPVISTKSATGHSLAVSGLLEAILSIETLNNNRILPSLNFSELGKIDGSINVNNTAKVMHVKHILSNSFGFGGENSSLILKRAEG
ncbi:3-oxoacyl-[acyl-carrier-protein] synthase-1/3-oxoacyl-[acyl-carrier-protein] synthase II [Xenorhabdus cabanillasii]|uniref:3-oxoacyl-[acyl-carrier-protein] synthase-1/3-oxoacyl-[acyl-carrier-protein] synthase II n=1 Tax=Xenorhabdus cabanillasii TaxID=351673 RepID=A0A3D9UE43_9GAMM|nr:beta-ketoacyl synthase N-terminal-like domain-containing protein [Xenorhabdus cabanillasii]REF27536.1 3-oxoacyl-[acyl-carrier-protein] synthase-1/3-oxoacyl-[acyl-carrier-protein] synthase II [Xenorhabdus cabanillasii]